MGRDGAGSGMRFEGDCWNGDKFSKREIGVLRLGRAGALLTLFLMSYEYDTPEGARSLRFHEYNHIAKALFIACISIM